MQQQRCWHVEAARQIADAMSVIRGKGYMIDTSITEDRYGFKYHRLLRVPAAKQALAMRE